MTASSGERFAIRTDYAVADILSTGTVVMKLELENAMEAHVRAGGRPREWINTAKAEGLIGSEKQAWRTLEKWCRQDRYEYGVSLDLGWMCEPYER